MHIHVYTHSSYPHRNAGAIIFHTFVLLSNLCIVLIRSHISSWQQRLCYHAAHLVNVDEVCNRDCVTRWDIWWSHAHTIYIQEFTNNMFSGFQVSGDRLWRRCTYTGLVSSLGLIYITYLQSRRVLCTCIYLYMCISILSFVTFLSFLLTSLQRRQVLV